MKSTQSGTDNPRQDKPRFLRRVQRSAWTPLVVVLIVLALIQGFAFKVYHIPSRSMQPTLEVGERVIVNRLPPARDSIEVGDLVAFEEPESWGSPKSPSHLRRVAGWVGDIIGFGPSNTVAVVKRVIAKEGQTVSCCDDEGAIIVDGVSVPPPYEANDYPFSSGVVDCQTQPTSQRCFAPFTVGKGELFVLGDNRTRSKDSLRECRVGAGQSGCAHTVAETRVIGTVWIRIWPPARLGEPA